MEILLKSRWNDLDTAKARVEKSSKLQLEVSSVEVDLSSKNVKVT